ncbi:MAG: glycosyltransferase [Lachnospiraceae bacterium]|nr:glycosyltransferase [Lachnospiraceae bacterium]
MKEKLSIIVPVYNVAAYLEQCINSILAQELKEFHLILVDDGSTDGSGVLCDAWAEKDSRIRVFHKTNGGLISAWKYGLCQADTEYVGFVDSDDWIDPDMYSRLLEEIEEKEADIAACGWISDKEDGGPVEKELVKAAGKVFRQGDFEKELYPTLISGGNYSWMELSPNRWSKLFRREILMKNLQFCDERVTVGEDLLMVFSVLPFAKSITVLKDFHPYHYRIHRASMMHQFKEETYSRLELLRQRMLELDQQFSYDFSVQINTYFVKLMLEQLDYEMLFANESKEQLKQRMRWIRENDCFCASLGNSETKRLPLKYRLYLFCVTHGLYSLLLLIRSSKKIREYSRPDDGQKDER